MYRRRARPEDELQRAVLTHLRVRGARDIFFFHVPNGGRRKPIEASILKGLGVVPGVPDLILIHSGKVYGLELKAEGGRVSEHQRAARLRMMKAGAECEVCFGLDASLAWLESRGLLVGKVT